MADGLELGLEHVKHCVSKCQQNAVLPTRSPGFSWVEIPHFSAGEGRTCWCHSLGYRDCLASGPAWEPWHGRLR